MGGARSWLKKLQLAKAVLLGDPPQARPDQDTLANVFIYLQVRCPGLSTTAVSRHGMACNQTLTRSSVCK